ncbi:patatin-like phospholipase family protein [Arenicella sp. 4NH20-0111]|uniref:patatin-like phospholipase family protein n=1 Tax=Arenicella sp. 4NH20-0111 TaxID=3127648 RepID=UPI00333ED6CE
MTATTPQNPNSRTALLLGGGGARAAYQVGVLRALSELLPKECDNPFPIICGTSAGSINTVALASNASDFHAGVERISQVWSQFELNHVFFADAKNLAKRITHWAWCNLGPGNWRNGPSSLLDNSPLRKLLTQYVDFNRIDKAIENGHLHGYCITACSYTSGESKSFFDGCDEIENWKRNRREGIREKLNIDHLMASSAIPVIFPSVRLGKEHYGDGSMRQSAPISPALHLGARKVLIIGLRIKEGDETPEPPQERPSLGQIFGYILDTLFLNSLQSDIERMDRTNHVLENHPEDNPAQLKTVEYQVVTPSEDIADIAQAHYDNLPRSFRTALKFLGMGKSNSRRLVSYLMFDSAFCQQLMTLGYNDAMRQKDTLSEFLGYESDRNKEK